jgi:hypothetical protein
VRISRCEKIGSVQQNVDCTPVSRTVHYTYAIRVRLFLYTVFTQGFTVFSDFHCKTHGFFSVYFRFRKPASPDQSVYGLFCVRYARSTDGGRLIRLITAYTGYDVLTVFSPFISVSGNPPVRTSQYTDYFAYVTRVVLTADG